MIRSHPRPDGQVELARRAAGWLLLALVVVLVLGVSSDVQLAHGQCVMCGDALNSHEDVTEVNRLKSGFFYSVLAMLGIPATLLGGLIFLIVYTNKKRAALSPPQSP